MDSLPENFVGAEELDDFCFRTGHTALKRAECFDRYLQHVGLDPTKYEFWFALTHHGWYIRRR